MQNAITIRRTQTIKAIFLFSLFLLSSLPLLADDLFDPSEAEKYRRKPGSITAELLQTATTQPTTQRADAPRSQPDSPFGARPTDRDDALPGYVELSDGTILVGLVFPTREKPWSVFEAESKSFRRIPPAVVRRIEAAVVWERDEPEWRWKDNGSDEKVFTGRTYPARMLRYAFTLANGETIAGTVQQPIHVRDAAGETMQFILHERDKGPLDAKLSSLVYVKRVELGPDAATKGKSLAAKRAATQPAR